MAEKRPKLEMFTTPPGIARQAYVTKPSTKFNPDGTYNIKIEFDPGEVHDLIAKANRLIEERVAEEIRKDPKIKKVIKTAAPFQPVLDDEGDETGKITLNFKRNAISKFKDKRGNEEVKVNKVKVVDTEGKVITDEVWAGSTTAARFWMSAYYIPKDKEVGVSLKLTHVMVVDLVSSGSNDGDEDVEKLGFAKVEGFKGTKTAASSDEDADDEESGEDDDAAAF